MMAHVEKVRGYVFSGFQLILYTDVQVVLLCSLEIRFVLLTALSIDIYLVDCSMSLLR